jgi:hypothetical protein
LAGKITEVNYKTVEKNRDWGAWPRCAETDSGHITASFLQSVAGAAREGGENAAKAAAAAMAASGGVPLEKHWQDMVDLETKKNISQQVCSSLRQQGHMATF